MTQITVEYQGDGVFKASSKFDNGVAIHAFRQGERIQFTDVKPRSGKQHRWWFAICKAAWNNLPEHLVERWPSAEHFRKAVLCMVGHCDVSQHVYSSHKDALNAALMVRFGDDFLIVSIDGNVLHLMRAKSQAFTAQKQDDFKSVIDASLQEMASILGIDPVSLLSGVHGVPAWVTEPYRSNVA